ncbi:kinase-like domain-containing protein [Suillus clintonianus]|uniref:kinase-like domain-containing protein n=1 Tax=Suillus clintonianus TaxID=1904413 RepID=UPI001B882CBD|nr:kinase-like domain-containing protein [Suillus clintonianus]KAG2124172.1 kinase-like domain-containing protein [Suillus clintonianus]
MRYIWYLGKLSGWDDSTRSKSFALRLPKADSLLPHQILNEVASISMISARCPNILVPKIYASSAEGPNPFVAQEYIDGEPLSTIWNRYTETEKHSVALTIAEIIVDMGETRFSAIGGFVSGTSTLGPTVEGSKIFKGRDKFHSNRCYPIGPHKTTKEYILACYDKEIYYYTHAPASDIDSDLFEHTSLEDFVQHLRDKRRELETSFVAEDEPFVLVHGDFHGRNIIMQGTRVQAVLDWEFAGAYPLGELLGGMGVDVLEVEDEESDAENTLWSREIVRRVEETARQRGWGRKELTSLLGNGDPILGYARVEMFPAEQ